MHYSACLIQLGPAEKRSPIKHDDNLKIGEGKFMTPEIVKYQPVERPKQVKPKDNLKPEGSFDKPEKPKYQPAERPKQVKPQDNLKPEGSFDAPKKPKYQPAERPKQVKPTDNLTTGDGKFVTPDKAKYQPAERPKQVKPKDNLKPEGSFDKPEKPGYRPAERAKPVKPVDNLRTGEGDFERRQKTDIVHTKIERTEVKKHRDQISLNEGKMETDTTSSTTFKKQPIQRHVVEDIVKKQKMRSNITLGDDTTILRTTNQMNFNTITTQKDRRVEKTTDVSDSNRIRDGTIAITTMKVTTVLENEKDHTPIKQVIRKGGQSNVREEVIHHTTDSDVINRKNVINEQHHVNEVNENVTNKRYIVNQHDVNSSQSIENRQLMNQSQITLNDRRTHQTNNDKRVIESIHSNGTVDSGTNQRHRTSNTVTSHSDHTVVNQSNVKETTESTNQRSSTMRTTESGSNVISIQDGISKTQISPTTRRKMYSYETVENTQTVSGPDVTGMKHMTSESERTTKQRSSNLNGSIDENVFRERSVVTSTPKGRQQIYSSDILNQNDTRTDSKVSASISQSDKINNQLHLRQHDSSSAISSISTTNRYNKSSTHTSNSNISSIIHDEQPGSMGRSSVATTERQRRDYVSSNAKSNIQPNQISNLNTQQHHRKNVLTSSSDVNNAVFHRKANLSTNSNEALHSNSMSSTAAIQRKSISNLHDQAIYNTSSDRKSYSSLHRQGKETISHSTSSSTIQTHQHQGGATSHSYSSTHTTSGGGSGAGTNRHTTSGTNADRTQKIVKKDNLSSSLGGEFYGKSESKAYGSFTSGHQHHVIDRATVNRRSNQSSFSLGDGQNHSTSVYRREYAVSHSGPCPAAHIEKSTFIHTRDTKSHKFFKHDP